MTALFSVAATFAAWKALSDFHPRGVGRERNGGVVGDDADGLDRAADPADPVLAARGSMDETAEAPVGDASASGRGSSNEDAAGEASPPAPPSGDGSARAPDAVPQSPGGTPAPEAGVDEGSVPGDVASLAPGHDFDKDLQTPGGPPSPDEPGIASLGPSDYDDGGLGPGINPSHFLVASQEADWLPPRGVYEQGTEQADSLVGGPHRDFLEGLGGNDTLIGLDGDDELYGGEGDDLLDGGAGWDLLDGGPGADEMRGGSGQDFYEVDDLGDRVIEDVDGGIDVIRTSVDLAGPLPLHVEALMLAGAAVSGTGNDADNVIVGNDLANVLAAGGGGDWLDGGSGADTMAGGSGDDIYVVNDADDIVTEEHDQGIDTVVTWSDHILAENVENLQLTDPFVNTSRFSELIEERNSFSYSLHLGYYGTIDIYRMPFYAFNVWETLFRVRRIMDARYDVVISGTGNELNNTIIGTAAYTDYVLSGGGGADTLIGNDSDDTLDGGTEADTMIGGPGSDTYVVDEVGDIVIEYEGAGIDSVWASIDYVLGAHLENLELAGAARTGTGNELGNTIIGTVAGMDYVLSGFGGRDILVGNTGDDILDGGRGADILRGGASDDWLDGGPDGDSLEGGDGDDTFIVDHQLDVVVEEAGGGSDTVWASVDHALDAHVEDLVLTGNATNGTGNDLDNRITGTVAGVGYTLAGLGGDDTLVGNDADDRLDGGQGADVLIGGAGADRFVLSWERGDDTIVDFTPGEDRIEIPWVLFGESEGTLEQDGEDVVVRLGSEASIRLENVTLSDLYEHDFLSGCGVRREGNTFKVGWPKDGIELVPTPPDLFPDLPSVPQASDPPALPSPTWPVLPSWDFRNGDGAASWNVVIVGEFYGSDILMGNTPPQLVSILAPAAADGGLSLSANTTLTFHEVWLAADGLIADDDVVHPTFVMETYYDL